MATVAGLLVKISADLKDFQAGMSKVQNQMQKVGADLQRVGSTISRSVTLPILGVAGAAVKAASDVEEMQAKFNTVFKTVGGSVSKELGNFAKEVNRSRYDLQGFAATFGDIIKPMGFTEESAADMSVTLTKLAVDLSSFNNMPMDEAVRRLRGTLIGAHENAAEFGVIINENTLKQELMRMGADKLEGAQKEQAKTQARLNLLLKGTTDAQGDAARTSGSFANQMRGLRDATRDLGVDIGTVLMPYAKELVATMRGLVDRFKNLSPEAKKTTLIVAGLAAAIGPVLFVIGGMSSGLAAVGRGFSLLLSLANPYVLAFAAIAAIGVVVYRNWDAIRAAFVGVWDAMGSLVDNIKDNFIPIWKGLFQAAAQAVTGNFAGAFQTLATTIVSASSGVKNDLTTFVSDVKTAVEPIDLAMIVDSFKIGDLIDADFMTDLSAKITGVKDTTKAGLETDEDSVAKSAEAAKTALAKIKTEVGNIEALAPSFTTLENALAGVETDGDDVDTALNKISTQVTNIEGLAPDFATLTKALGSETLTDKSLVVMSGNAATGIKGIGDEVTKLENVKPDFSSLNTAIQESTSLLGGIFDEIPTTLTMPEGYEDVIRDVIPDADETHRWSKFVSGMGTVKGDIKEASGFSFEFAGYISDVEQAWGKLVPKDAPQWMKDLSTYATDAALIVAGLESMVTLLQPATWLQAIGTIGKLASGLAGIVAALAPAIGAGIAIYSIARLFGVGDTEKPWERMGITQEEWEQMNIESGANAAFISNLMGPGADLSWLTNPTGEPPNWLQGLQLWQSSNGGDSSGGGAFGFPNLGGLVSGLSGQNVQNISGQTINVNLDGQTIATATVPYMANELEVFGTNY